MENTKVDILPPVHRPGLVRRPGLVSQVARPQEFGEEIARAVAEWHLKGSNLPSSQGIGLVKPLQPHSMASLQGIFGSNILPELGDKLASMEESEMSFWASQALSSQPPPLQLIIGSTELLVQLAGLGLVRKDSSQHLFYGEPFNNVARVLPVTVTGASFITLIMQCLPISPSTRFSVDAAAFILAVGGALLKE